MRGGSIVGVCKAQDIYIATVRNNLLFPALIGILCASSAERELCHASVSSMGGSDLKFCPIWHYFQGSGSIIKQEWNIVTRRDAHQRPLTLIIAGYERVSGVVAFAPVFSDAVVNARQPGNGRNKSILPGCTPLHFHCSHGHRTYFARGCIFNPPF